MAKSTIDSPVWFITGCSTGFGREFVLAALAHGFRVVATARDPKLDDLIPGHEDKAIAEYGLRPIFGLPSALRPRTL
jgi:NAD(P)-dependent dehydrogenase (short-subunit alcohol dehydrogenase family)